MFYTFDDIHLQKDSVEEGLRIDYVSATPHIPVLGPRQWTVAALELRQPLGLMALDGTGFYPVPNVHFPHRTSVHRDIDPTA